MFLIWYQQSKVQAWTREEFPVNKTLGASAMAQNLFTLSTETLWFPASPSQPPVFLSKPWDGGRASPTEMSPAMSSSNPELFRAVKSSNPGASSRLWFYLENSLINSFCNTGLLRPLPRKFGAAELWEQWCSIHTFILLRGILAGSRRDQGFVGVFVMN